APFSSAAVAGIGSRTAAVAIVARNGRSRLDIVNPSPGSSGPHSGTTGAEAPAGRARYCSSTNREVRLHVGALLDQRRDAAVLARDRDAGAVREAAGDGVRHVEDAGRDGVLSAR